MTVWIATAVALATLAIVARRRRIRKRARRHSISAWLHDPGTPCAVRRSS